MVIHASVSILFLDVITFSSPCSQEFSMLECSHIYSYYCSIVFAFSATMTTPMGVLQPSSFIGRTHAIGGPTTSIPSFLKCSWRGESIHGASFPASVPQVGFRSKQTAVRSSVEPSGGEINLWLCPSCLHVFW